MRNHYIPQYYLQGFANDSGKIWFYDKQALHPVNAPIKTVGQEKDYYTDDVERFLNIDIEVPANRALKKIRDRCAPNNEEKLALSKYLAIIHRRVPSGKEKFQKVFPNIFNRIVSEVKNDLETREKEMPDKKQIIQKRKNELQIMERDQTKHFHEIWLSLLHPKYTPKVIDALNNMKWVFIEAPDRAFFVTSDNPFFYFTGIGIGKTNSEFSFPISKNIALHGSWQNVIEGQYIKAPMYIINEINSRTISNSLRYVFSPQNASWVLEKIKRRNFRLKSIIWDAQ